MILAKKVIREGSKNGNLRVNFSQEVPFFVTYPLAKTRVSSFEDHFLDPLFWGFLEIGKKAAICQSKNGSPEKGPEKGSKNWFFHF